MFSSLKIWCRVEREVKVNSKVKERKINHNGEFDPGSGLTLAACLIHASLRETPASAGGLKWRTGE